MIADWKLLAQEQIDKVFEKYVYGEAEATAKMPVIDQGDLDLFVTNVTKAAWTRDSLSLAIEGVATGAGTGVGR
jgi:hypothetical protein